MRAHLSQVPSLVCFFKTALVLPGTRARGMPMFRDHHCLSMPIYLDMIYWQGEAALSCICAAQWPMLLLVDCCHWAAVCNGMSCGLASCPASSGVICYGSCCCIPASTCSLTGVTWQEVTDCLWHHPTTIDSALLCWCSPLYMCLWCYYSVDRNLVP